MGKDPLRYRSVPPTNSHLYLSRLNDDADLKKTMNEGNRFLGMHNWKDTLNDEQIRDLILCIRSVAPQGKVTPEHSKGVREQSEMPDGAHDLLKANKQ